MIKIKVVVDENVKKFLNDDKNFLTVDLKAQVSWDVKSFLKPSVLIGKPVDFSNYIVYKSNEVDIYVSKNIKNTSIIEIKTITLFGLENIVALLKK